MSLPFLGYVSSDDCSSTNVQRNYCSTWCLNICPKFCSEKIYMGSARSGSLLMNHKIRNVRGVRLIYYCMYLLNTLQAAYRGSRAAIRSPVGPHRPHSEAQLHQPVDSTRAKFQPCLSRNVGRCNIWQGRSHEIFNIFFSGCPWYWLAPEKFFEAAANSLR